MTDEGRIARRVALRDGDLRARVAGTRTGYSEVIEGNRHPELLLPYELFDDVWPGLDPRTRRGANVHKLLDPKIRMYGYDVDQFWKTFGEASRTYTELRARFHGRNAMLVTLPGGNKILMPVSQPVCVARLTALHEARRLLGGEEFDRFLYTAVAPNVGISSMSSIDPMNCDSWPEDVQNRLTVHSNGIILLRNLKRHMC
jgi:hypothetical protein